MAKTKIQFLCNACGSVQSAVALVRVQPPCAPPAVVTNPQGTTVTAGDPVTLSALGSGTNLTYRWFDQFGNFLGTGATITFTPAPLVDTPHPGGTISGSGASSAGGAAPPSVPDTSLPPPSTQVPPAQPPVVAGQQPPTSVAQQPAAFATSVPPSLAFVVPLLLLIGAVFFARVFTRDATPRTVQS